MKKKFIYLLTMVSLLFTASCEDMMDDINENVDNPSDVASKYIIPDALTSSAFSITATDYAFYASVYIEHNVGIYGQMYNAETRTSEPISSTTYNNTWNSNYSTLYSLKMVIDKCSEGGDEEGNYTTLGIAQVMTAYNLAILTDVMGDVPWSEALQPGVILQPTLDKQEAIYEQIFQYLKDGIENLGKETTHASLGKQDFIYGGDAELWTKFAYGLQARYLMRLSKISPKYNDVITAADNSFEEVEEQAIYTYDGAAATSPFYAFLQDRDYFGCSQSLKNKLDDRNDPRGSVFFKKYPGAASLVFAPNGKPEQIQKKYGISGLTSPTAPTYLLSYHELEFLKAEAYARLGNNPKAEASLIKAITAAFVKVGLTEGDAEEYYNASVKGRFNANPTSEIMMQKYLAFFEEESLEAYNDYRRLKAMGNNFITLENPKNTESSPKFPYRFVYGNSDVSANPNVFAATGDGQYVYSENVWWAGGAR